MKKLIKKYLSKKSSQRGFTLIETMIAAAISTGLTVAVMQAVVSTNQSIKSASVSNDWINLLQTIRSVYSDPTYCKKQFGTIAATPLNLNWGGAAVTLKSFSRLELIDSGGTSKAQFLDIATVINNMMAVHINVVTSPGNTTQTVQYLGAGAANQALLDVVELDLVVDKYKQDGSNTLLTGGVTRLQSNSARGNPIKFAFLRNTGTGALLDCYTLPDAAQQACNEMGGTYGAATPKCQLPNLYLGANTSAAAPSAATGAAGALTAPGQRIQLSGRDPVGGTVPAIATNHTMSATDYGVGYNTDTMWFNAGGTNSYEGYNWWNMSGATSLAHLSGTQALNLKVSGGNVPYGVFGYQLTQPAVGSSVVTPQYFDSVTAPSGIFGRMLITAATASPTLDCNNAGVGRTAMLGFGCDCSCTNQMDCQPNGVVNNSHSITCSCLNPSAGDVVMNAWITCAKY